MVISSYLRSLESKRLRLIIKWTTCLIITEVLEVSSPPLLRSFWLEQLEPPFHQSFPHGQRLGLHGFGVVIITAVFMIQFGRGLSENRTEDSEGWKGFLLAHSVGEKDCGLHWIHRSSIRVASL